MQATQIVIPQLYFYFEPSFRFYVCQKYFSQLEILLLPYIFIQFSGKFYTYI